MKTLMTFVLVLFLTIPSTQAQNYKKQFAALRKAVKAKSGTPLLPFISEEMAIPPMIAKEQLTPEILEKVLEDVLKDIQSVSLKESKKDELVVFYDFVEEDTKDRISSIILDSEGKIKEIKIIAALIVEARERNKGKEAEQPIADEFTKKYPARKVKFNTEDNRTVFGNLYDVGKEKPVILLCHQASSNKYEYADIAPKLNAMGFNALAVDLSGGDAFAAHQNETVDNGTPLSSSLADREIVFTRLKAEMKAAIDYLNQEYQQSVIVWGSSYTASFTIAIVAKYEKARAAISFSGLAGGLSNVLPEIDKPVFMTSSKEEVPVVSKLLEGVSSNDHIVHYIPRGEGGHGSSVLWNGQPYADEYWTALKGFLNTLK